MDYFDTRHNIENIVYTELRKKHGDDAITQRLTPGMRLTTSAPADYAAAIGIAQQVARVAQSLAYDYAKKARGEGKPWHALAEPLGLSTDPDEYGNSAEAAFELVAPKPSMRFDLVTVHWTCASCGQSITIKVRLSGEPDEIARLVEHLREHFDLAGGDRAYPNRGSFGVRVYLELREPLDPNGPRRIRSERINPHRKQVEP